MGPRSSLGLNYFGLQNMFRKIPILGIYHLINYDDLMESGVWVIPKIIFTNLGNLQFRPIHRVIIIPVSSDSFNLKIVERKEKKLQKYEYVKNEKSFLDGFFLVKLKKEKKNRGCKL